ncbi:myoE, partial [Symbiodinium microadriaticum]
MMQVFLERGRVIARPKGESSFHVFYLLFASIIDGVESSNDVQLDPNAEYRYLDPLSRMRNDGERRELVRQFLRLLDDMALLGIDSKAQNDLCRTLAAIVLLGNVQFCRKGTDGSLGTDTDDSECTVDPACCDGPLLSQYLGVADISQLLTTKVIPGGRTSSFYQVGLTGSQARANADNLATGLYYKLFGWVVTVANSKSKLSVESCASTGRRLSAASHSNYVGILDMCGFEMSENNSSFEQLCVNYCNEKLYSVFYSEIFASELALLTSEGCPHTVPGGYDNTPCLSLLEGETGLIRLIDEHCVLSRAGQDDSTLLSLFCQHHPKNTHFECGLLAKRRSVGETRFKVQHYRGPVVYDITGFMNGNSEKIEIDSMLE